MKALSIQQPWAWLIVNGYKDVENRDWPTRMRGTILVHTGQKFDKDGWEWVMHAFPDIPLPLPGELPRGGIVGQVNITGCVEDMDSPWFFGTYGFRLADAKACDFRPCSGKLGFFDVTP